MSSFADCPLEVIEVVIDLLRGYLDALKACSQTCTALLPLCRKYIFQSLILATSQRSGYSTPGTPSNVTVIRPKFWHVLDTNPTISEYVYTLTYYIDTYDSLNDDVPRVLERLRHVRSFYLYGGIPKAGCKQAPQRFRDTLLRVVQSRFITCLKISVDDFPITAFLACVNLTDLSISDIYFDSADVDEQESSTLIFSNLDLKVSDIRVPRLQVFAYEHAMSGQYAMRLLNAKCPNGGPMVDFTNVRTLCVYLEEDLDLTVVHALVNATNKLETLRYNLDNFNGEYGSEYGSIAPSINKRSLSTLKRLHLSYDFEVHESATEFVCGICKELGILSGLPNVIEEIAIEAESLSVRRGELDEDVVQKYAIREKEDGQTMYSDVAGATEPVCDLDRIKDFMYVPFSPCTSLFPTYGINKCTMTALQKYTKPSHHQSPSGGRNLERADLAQLCSGQRGNFLTTCIRRGDNPDGTPILKPLVASELRSTRVQKSLGWPPEPTGGARTRSKPDMVVLDSLRQGRRDWAQIDFAFPHHLKGLKAHAVLKVPEVPLGWRLAQSQQFYITSKLTLKAHGVGAFNYQAC
ncbi:uncharacterized protein LACBIDRAFT_331388 [Laccaria bicolor S238N-H82]|uniref:Predicted protein n=1 Tax=Laccaria bicolor (strain S238N-H82 / ATCC MYA-4686) TaxID=486041 RepID=B0DPC0_LACBS|nr:uncharacterized protein LACBIDRAFT_331388 [Laccaria bicolor S238N-H82]EDR03592.1 predicted protein [Laccaria bicolor S238N-H82]|eukprot:XP_001885740.1 predicted protein [Laccaria bicolor S238N-H82]